MKLCEDCMTDYEIEKNDGAGFPSFMVVGGAIGSIAGLATGVLLFIPAGLLGGLAADVARCDRCGSDEKEYQLMIEKDRWDTKIYKPFARVAPFRGDQNQYRYDDVEARFTVIEGVDSMDTLDIDTSFSDFPDYGVSFDVQDASLQVESVGPDIGGVSDWGSDSGSGEGGDGSTSGGEAGGGD